MQLLLERRERFIHAGGTPHAFLAIERDCTGRLGPPLYVRVRSSRFRKYIDHDYANGDERHSDQRWEIESLLCPDPGDRRDQNVS